MNINLNFVFICVMLLFSSCEVLNTINPCRLSRGKEMVGVRLFDGIDTLFSNPNLPFKVISFGTQKQYTTDFIDIKDSVITITVIGDTFTESFDIPIIQEYNVGITISRIGNFCYQSPENYTQFSTILGNEFEACFGYSLEECKQ